MEWTIYKQKCELKMQNALIHYQNQLNEIVASNASPNILNNIKVDYYDTLTPLLQIASISIVPPNQILIKPFDNSINKKIVSAIHKSPLNLNVTDEGDKLRINLPVMTEERRKEYVKLTSVYAEKCKIQIRNIRQEFNKDIKSDDELSQDEQNFFKNNIQKITDQYIEKIENLHKEKAKKLMTL